MFDVTPYVECLFQVHPATATQIIQHESGGKPWALNVNALKGQTPPKFRQPNNQQDAIALAKQFIQQGHTVDLGLMQINSNNLPHYRVTLEQIFDPCTNLRVGSTILYEGYQRALSTTKNPQLALQKALSIYNTGNMHYGFQNGYVSRYVKAAKPTQATSTQVNIGDLYD
ncbi:conjugal transfer protein [Vibrio parahaemolyticus]|uniref:lytic transglycosylase domain-containing protein n=1 Tax=Vibrio parahaemolyticus TaxID=670 RepID=UPI000A3BA4F9|nr:lytic transglycosylase domain-containing protein [Vibrio parahaemolyticus]MDF4269727.1 lytic transglycosylase domain-containing protein [Vibrio parahaemolyticus]MDF4275063.1 lytic transglycosylase domain-containing protein [Vibrio parahaemolyticus]MDF4299655.1 lytic transglycosylase domain-containing protein [Vibrio parahaemolyticus]OUJ23207.1 conjugal transfer protein [Vibrio parahaemolyticus]TOH11443.1 conjugal transfer protein [Vibrio parahaemolyticus]